VSRPRSLLLAVVAVALVGAAALGGCGSSSSSSASSAGSTPTSGAAPTSSGAQTNTTGSSGAATHQTVIGFEGVAIEQGPDLAPADTTQTGPVDGIQCGATEQLEYHIHAHLAVYLNGTPRAVPGGIGIPGSMVEESSEGPVAAGGECIYWLHTHAPDGVIHIESPTRRIYSLGNFFDIWHQPLSTGRVGNAAGRVTALVDGKRWKQDPRAIPLLPHAVIQLDVGAPTPPFHGMSWAGLAL
jgi:hypothetical protein